MSLRHAVLGLLATGPASGYDLLKAFDISLANVWPATQSQLYGELGKLADGGLIVVASEGPRGRKAYEITDDGRDELRNWIVDVPPSRSRRNDMLLRVFFLNAVTPAEAVAYLQSESAHSTETRKELERLIETIPWDDAPLSVYGRIALEWGLRFYGMQAAWATWAHERVEAAGLTS